MQPTGGFMGKKITKKEKRYQKRQAFLSRLVLPGDELNKPAKTPLAVKKAMSDLSRALPSIPSQVFTDVKQKTFNKQEMRDVMEMEVSQFGSVINNRAFQTNPLDAIRQHLSNTISDEVNMSTEQDWRLSREAHERAKNNNAIVKKKANKKKSKNGKK
jgi:hypothetical protein